MTQPSACQEYMASEDVVSFLARVAVRLALHRPVYGPFPRRVIGPPFTAGNRMLIVAAEPRSRGFSLFGFSRINACVELCLKPNSEKPRERGSIQQTSRGTPPKGRPHYRSAQSPVKGSA